MAAKRRTKQYSNGDFSSYGNVAYQPEYEHNAVRDPVKRSKDRPKVVPQKHTSKRSAVKVRQQGAVSLFAVVGFLAVIICMFFLLSTAIQLAVVADETFDLQDQLSVLKEDEKKLLAEYELAYDLSEIEQQMTASGAMVRASSSNTIYMDMTEMDSIIYYEEATDGIPGLVDRLEQIVRNLLGES